MKPPIVLVIRDPELRNAIAQKARERDHEVIARFQSEGWTTVLRNFQERGVFLVGNDVADADPGLLVRKAAGQFAHFTVARVGANGSGGLWLCTADGEELGPYDIDDVIAWATKTLRTEEPPKPDEDLETIADGPALPVRICGNNPEIRRILRMVDTVAPTASTVLIQGESGTGKDLFARLIHQKSRRREGPWVTVNCGAIPPSLMESELFGHAKGAFTGADVQKDGLFLVADTGTLFLDEVGELPLDTQVKLLRVLQGGSFRPVGDTRTHQVDVRIIAATNRELKEEVRSGRFRLDLFYRLNVISIETPPLRERFEDLPELIASIVQRLTKKGIQPVAFDDATMRTLVEYRWPGNIRELENIVERLLLLHPNGHVPKEETRRHLQDLGMEVGSEDAIMGKSAAITSDLRYPEEMTLKELEQAHIRRVLAKHQGNKTQAARALGINVKTLYNKMKTAGMSRGEFVTVEA